MWRKSQQLAAAHTQTWTSYQNREQHGLRLHRVHRGWDRSTEVWGMFYTDSVHELYIAGQNPIRANVENSGKQRVCQTGLTYLSVDMYFQDWSIDNQTVANYMSRLSCEVEFVTDACQNVNTTMLLNNILKLEPLFKIRAIV